MPFDRWQSAARSSYAGGILQRKAFRLQSPHPLEDALPPAKIRWRSVFDDLSVVDDDDTVKACNVERRCATATTVFSSMISTRERWIASSLSVSRADVASSMTMIDASFRNARSISDPLTLPAG